MAQFIELKAVKHGFVDKIASYNRSSKLGLIASYGSGLLPQKTIELMKNNKAKALAELNLLNLKGESI